MAQEEELDSSLNDAATRVTTLLKAAIRHGFDRGLRTEAQALLGKLKALMTQIEAALSADVSEADVSSLLSSFEETGPLLVAAIKSSGKIS